MQNKQGYTIQDRIKQDIAYIEGITEDANRALLATKALGAADLAVEFGLITYEEWEKYIEQIFKLM